MKRPRNPLKDIFWKHCFYQWWFVEKIKRDYIKFLTQCTWLYAGNKLAQWTIGRGAWLCNPQLHLFYLFYTGNNLEGLVSKPPITYSAFCLFCHICFNSVLIPPLMGKPIAHYFRGYSHFLIWLLQNIFTYIYLRFKCKMQL